jgi:hypothetical protein
MSTPNACGSAALLVDYYDDLFTGDAMRASTLKGLILHTADDLGRAGPDYQYGWGLMNTRAAAELLKDYAEGNPIRLTEDLLSSSDLSDIYTGYADGSAPVRVTLCWTDPPGTATLEHDLRAGALVNDLDLKITGPDGTHYPYTLSYADPEADAAIHVKNRVDNTEQVYIDTPAAGSYTISVDYEGSLQSGLQHYSLLIDGLVSDLDSDGLPDNWESSYFLSTTGGLATADADGDGLDNLSEYIAGSDPTNPASVFGIASAYSPPSTGSPPFVIAWDGVPGRVYRVYWSYNLIYLPFTQLPGEIHWPVNSYTDLVERAGNQGFYYIDVRLDE